MHTCNPFYWQDKKCLNQSVTLLSLHTDTYTHKHTHTQYQSQTHTVPHTNKHTHIQCTHFCTQLISNTYTVKSLYTHKHTHRVSLTQTVSFLSYRSQSFVPDLQIWCLWHLSVEKYKYHLSCFSFSESVGHGSISFANGHAHHVT